MTTPLSPVLPHDSEAEKAVLGGVLIDPDQLVPASEIVVPDDFFSEHNRLSWIAMLELGEEGQPLDPLTVRVKLEQQHRLDKVGAAYLFTLVDGVPHSLNVPAYATRVRELSDRRRMILTARKLEAQASDQNVPILELCDAAQRAVLDLTARQAARGLVSIADVLRIETLPALEKARATLAQHRGIPGLPTGYAALDAQLGGLHPGRTYVVAARTSVGKTAFIGGVASHVGVELGTPVAVFSPEMSSHDLTVRELARVSRVNVRHLLGGCSSAEDWQRVTATIPVLSRAPIYLDDSSTLTLSELRARARRLHVEVGPLGLCVLDYVQLVHDPALRAETRNLELAMISRTLRALDRRSAGGLRGARPSHASHGRQRDRGIDARSVQRYSEDVRRARSAQARHRPRA